jgi:hypothetical protein
MARFEPRTFLFVITVAVGVSSQAGGHEDRGLNRRSRRARKKHGG